MGIREDGKEAEKTIQERIINIIVTGYDNEWTKEDVTLTVEANIGKELADEPYSFDGGETWQSDNEETFTERTPGVEILIKDSEGNITEYEEILDIKIDKTGTKVTVVKEDATPNTITVKVEVEDKDAGMAQTPTYEYYIKKSNETDYPNTPAGTTTDNIYFVFSEITDVPADGVLYVTPAYKYNDATLGETVKDFTDKVYTINMPVILAQ